MFRTTGQVVGVGITSSIAQSVLTRKLTDRLTGDDAGKVSILDRPVDRRARETDKGPVQIIARIRHSTSSIAELDPHQRQIAVSAYNDALHVVFWVQTGLGILALLACMGMREVHLPDKGPSPSSQQKANDDEVEESSD
jgi:hypothetical protein